MVIGSHSEQVEINVDKFIGIELKIKLVKVRCNLELPFHEIDLEEKEYNFILVSILDIES